ncbi:MAG: DUF1542 domain-containing protein [Vagococcus sp.]|uniref:DUF1542 domain-containing protein n=1 Tax=Vagococcus sp. TaxID=1933889 RepID=UPI002FC938F4
MKKKNIQHIKSETKHLGRGKLIKKNKVLVSVLTTSVFLTAAISATAESLPIEQFFEPANAVPFAAATEAVPFPQEFNKLDKVLGDKEETAKKAKVDRYVYANFGGFQLFDSTGTKTSWNDDRMFSNVGSGTATWKTASGPQSKKALFFKSPDATSGIKWELDLMPNTNYTFTLQNTLMNFNGITNGKVIITDVTNGKVLTEGKIGPTAAKFDYKFTTPTSDTVAPKIRVEVLGKSTTETQISGDFWFTATDAKIAEDKTGNTEKLNSFYKLSKVQGKTVDALMTEQDLVYYDSANNNSQIIPTYGDKTIIDATSVGAKSKIFTGTGTVAKWGKSQVTGKLNITVTNDIQLIADIDKAATDTIAAINADSSLTAATKAEQIKAVEDAQKVAKGLIEEGNSAKELEDATANGIKAITDAHVAGAPLADQQKEAKADLKEVADATKVKINGDANLSKDEKEQQIKNVDAALKAAEDAIDATETVEAMEAALTTGEADIKSKYAAGTALETQKETAKTAITDELKKVTDAIEGDNTLTTTEKEEQKKTAKEAADAATKAIDEAETADGILDAKNSGMTAIDEAHKEVTSLEKRKEEAIKEIEAAKKEAILKIDGDNTLTEAEKQNKKQL